MKLYNELEAKNNLYINKNSEFNLPLFTPFVEQIKNIDRPPLYSFKGPFELLHADIADIRFLANSEVDPKYCLLFLDLFTSKIYTYPIKNRTLLKKKLEVFYNDISKKKKR